MARKPLAAEITLDDLEGYRKDIESVTKEAVGSFERRCREAIAEEGGSLDGESIGRIRDEVAGLMEDCVGAYGDATQSIASRMFEDVLERQGEPDDVPMAGIDFSKRAKASARQWAGLLFRDPPDVEGFVNGVSSFVERHVRHSADYCVLEAANGRKFRKRIRYARVPSGPSCGFCIMLASRGFVYASEETAGAFSKFHTGCDCSVIAGYEGLKVAGYDYDGMYERYEACRKALGTPEDVWREFESLPLDEKDRYGGTRLAKIGEMPRSLIEQIGSNADNFNDYYAHRIAAEMDRRDRRWLYDGTEPCIDYSRKQRGAFGVLKRVSDVFNPDDYSIENFVSRKDNEWADLFAHDALKHGGFRLEMYGNDSIDAKVGGLWYEVKSPKPPKSGDAKPSEKNKYRFIENDVRTAVRQFSDRDMPLETRIVFNPRYKIGLDMERVRDEFFRQCKKHRVKDGLFIWPDGTIERLR